MFTKHKIPSTAEIVLLGSDNKLENCCFKFSSRLLHSKKQLRFLYKQNNYGMHYLTVQKKTYGITCLATISSNTDFTPLLQTDVNFEQYSYRNYTIKCNTYNGCTL